MKELSIEEKARRYDEAFEKAKRYYDEYKTRDNVLYVEDMEDMFPELKESEDELIRKELLAWLKSRDGQTLPIDRYNAAIAWLEKQGEHAKFRDSIQVGDKVTRNEDGVLVNMSQLKRVAKKDEKQGEKKPVVPKFRVGDKVKEGYLTYTVEDIDEDSYKLQAYSKDGDKGCTVFLTIGYEKDYELVEQESAEWSEEDEARFESCIKMLQTLDGYDTINTKWLKSLKDRVQPQPKQEWGEEEVEIIDWLVASFDCLKIPTDTFYQSKVRPFLISLRNKIQPIIKEWSEEDDKMINSIAVHLNATTGGFPEDRAWADKFMIWLKSLRPQNTWKPSDEQMKILNEVLNFAANHESPHWNDYIFGTLNNLIRQLKKL